MRDVLATVPKLPDAMKWAYPHLLQPTTITADIYGHLQESDVFGMRSEYDQTREKSLALSSSTPPPPARPLPAQMPKELEIRFLFDSLRVHVVRRQLTFLTDILAGIESHLRVARYRATRPLLTKPAGGGARGTSAERSWRPFWWYAYRCVQLDLQLRRSKRGWPAAQHHSLVALQYLALRKQLSGVLHSKTFFTFETEHEHVNESIEGVPDSEDLRPATQRDLEVAASVLSCRPRCFALRSLCLRSPEGSEGEGAPGTPSLADLETLSSLHRVQLEFDCTLPILTAISMRLLAVNRGDFVPRRPVPATEPQDGADGTVTTPERTAARVTQPLTATVQTPIRSGTLTITLAELAGVKDSGVGLAKPVVSAWIGGRSRTGRRSSA